MSDSPSIPVITRSGSKRRPVVIVITEPVELLDCHFFSVRQPLVHKGPDNIQITGCSDGVVIGGVLSDPQGPNDPNGKHLKIDKSQRLTFHGIRMVCLSPGGDGVGISESEDITVQGCIIKGPRDTLTDKAAGMCIDYLCKNITFRKNVVEGPGKVAISIASGTNLRIEGNRLGERDHPWLSSGVQIGGSNGVMIRDIIVLNNTICVAQGSPPVWWESGKVKNLVINGQTVV